MPYINDTGILLGLKNAVMALDNFNKELQEKIDKLRVNNPNLTREDAINIILNSDAHIIVKNNGNGCIKNR